MLARFHEYWLDVASQPDGFDIFAGSAGTSLSKTVTNLPTNGRRLYVTLWTAVNGTWQKHRVTYTASGAAPFNPDGDTIKPAFCDRHAQHKQCEGPRFGAAAPPTPAPVPPPDQRR